VKKSTQYFFVQLLLVASLCISVLALPSVAAAAEREHYIVSGASGELGTLVVRELLKRGVAPQDLILVSHRPERLAEFAAMGATVREGDLTRPETLVPAYTGGTKMVLLAVGVNMKEPRSVLHKRGIDAAVKAGVRHIIYTSWIAAADSKSQISTDHRLTEEALRASGKQWTILRIGEYADNWVLGAARNMAARGRAVQIPDERWSAPTLYADDAAATAGALLSPSAVNQIYYITGPERITQTDIARVTSEVAGRKIEVVPGKAGVGLENPVAPRPDAGFVRPDMAPPVGEPNLPSFTAAQLADNVRRFRQLTGRNPTSLRQMIEAHKPEILKAMSAPQTGT
jgi:NAD(P)H dehydrogenase (quinone)